ncbi:MAG: hypothetical protein RJA70_4130 [Pseudomonadota bacterium]
MNKQSMHLLGLLTTLPLGLLAGCAYDAEPTAEERTEFGQTESALTKAFDKNNDLLALHYDNMSDRDDGTCQGAAKMMVDKLAIQKVSVVHGAAGNQITGSSGTETVYNRVCPASNGCENYKIENVANAVWGSKCNPSTQVCGSITNGWIDLHGTAARTAWWTAHRGDNNYTLDTASPEVQDVAAYWKTFLDAGKHVYVAEGGQSVFTLDVLHRIKALNASFNGAGVHVVQHSLFNEVNAWSNQGSNAETALESAFPGIDYMNEAQTGTYGTESTSDGTTGSSGSGTGSETRNFYNASLTSSYATKWQAVWAYNNPLGTVYYGTQSNKIDFSDTNELFEITGQAAIASDILTFFTRFDNGSGGGSPPAATCSDGIQNQGETGTDCGGPCSACGGSCGPANFQGQCTTDSQCGTLYAGSNDCRSSEGGVCYCGTSVCGCSGGSGSANIWLEAECGSSKVGGYTTTRTATSGYSGTGYLESIADTTAATPPCTDSVSYVFTPAAAGAHKVWFRAHNNNTGNDNSVFYRVNGGSWVTMNPVLPVAAAWAWGKYSSDATLTSGSNTLQVCNRENGLKIDKLYITSSTTTPSGTGSAGTNCP